MKPFLPRLRTGRRSVHFGTDQLVKIIITATLATLSFSTVSIFQSASLLKDHGAMDPFNLMHRTHGEDVASSRFFEMLWQPMSTHSEQRELDEADTGGLGRDPITLLRNHTESATCHPYFLVGTEGPQVVYHHPDNPQPKYNAVLTYLTYEKRIEETMNSLILLEHYFLRRYQYPVHIFYENLNETTRLNLAALIPNATSVTFERICFEKNTPLGSPSYDEAWKMLSDSGMGWPGYAQMCRFYSGTIFMLPSLLRYDYYWRLDTDLYVNKYVERDPFDLMYATNCSFYYYGGMEIDWEKVTQNLWYTTMEWFNSSLKPIIKDKILGPEYIARVKRIRLNSKGEYDRKGYKTHFTVSEFGPFRSDTYLSLFRYYEASLGFYRYRWGDLPILGIAVPLMLEPDHVCQTGMSVMHRGTPMLPSPATLKPQDMTNEFYVQWGARTSMRQPPMDPNSLAVHKNSPRECEDWPWKKEM